MPANDNKKYLNTHKSLEPSVARLTTRQSIARSGFGFGFRLRFISRSGAADRRYEQVSSRYIWGMTPAHKYSISTQLSRAVAIGGLQSEMARWSNLAQIDLSTFSVSKRFSACPAPCQLSALSIANHLSTYPSIYLSISIVIPWQTFSLHPSWVNNTCTMPLRRCL